MRFEITWAIDAQVEVVGEILGVLPETPQILTGMHIDAGPYELVDMCQLLLGEGKESVKHTFPIRDAHPISPLNLDVELVIGDERTLSLSWPLPLRGARMKVWATHPTAYRGVTGDVATAATSALSPSTVNALNSVLRPNVDSHLRDDEVWRLDDVELEDGNTVDIQVRMW